MLAITIACQPGGQFEPGFAAGDEVQQCGGDGATDHLRHDVGRQLPGRESAADHQPHRDGRVKVTAADMPDGKCHGQHREPKSQGHPEQADANVGERCGQYRTPAATQHQPKRTQSFRYGTFEQ